MGNEHRLSTTVLRAFTILDQLASKKNGASLTDVSNDLGVSKSTAHRYLVTLEKLGAVKRDDSDHFSLGPKLVELAGVFLDEHNLRGVSEPLLDELAARTGETIHLAVPSVNEVVYIAKVASAHSIQMASRIGGRMPLHCTSLGKAILAYSPERVKEIIDDGLTARTPNTITSPDVLRAELERVRDLGFAVDDEENEEGVRCVGAPVFDHTSDVQGAISVSGPASRISEEQLLEWGPLVRETALEVSRRMGYRR